MKRLLNRVLILAFTTALLGCYPEGPEYTEDLDVVYTTYDDTYDFQGQNTFTLPPKIVTDVKVKNGDTTFVYMKEPFNTQILQAIEDNMESLGWTKVAGLIDDPDVALMPAAISTTTYYYSYWYDWWYGGYWGWYYPPYYSVSSITTGSLVITMADPGLAESSPIGQSSVCWLMVGNGIATGYGDISRVTDAIDQAFDQSPYLKIN
jgi:Domain of unknown function (DUF4136)